MKIAVDFDGTIVEQDHAYDDLDTPLRFIQGAREALLSLRGAEHVLFLWSARSNLALRLDWRLNPLWVCGADPFDEARWERQRALNESRYQQMREFVDRQLSGVFHAVDDGRQGKPMVDAFIDDRGLRFGTGARALGWDQIAELWGNLVYSPNRGGTV